MLYMILKKNFGSGTYELYHELKETEVKKAMAEASTYLLNDGLATTGDSRDIFQVARVDFLDQPYDARMLYFVSGLVEIKREKLLAKLLGIMEVVLLHKSSIIENQ